jgi:hypothetical protein
LTPNGRSPVWSPDESQVAFLREDERTTDGRPTYTIFRKKLDGSPAVAVWSGAGIIVINDWSGDGQFLLLTIFATANPGIEHWILPNPLSPTASHEPVQLRPGRKGHAQFVPSRGRPLGITVDGVFVCGMPETPGEWQVGGERASLPRWRADGRELFFHDGGDLHVVERLGSLSDISFGRPKPLFRLPPAFQSAGGQWVPGWDVTPDGKRFLVANPPPDAPGSIAIVTNWEQSQA